MEHINKGILALVERPELRHESLREGVVNVEERVCQHIDRPGHYRFFTVNHGIRGEDGEYVFRIAYAKTVDEAKRMLREGIPEGRDDFSKRMNEIFAAMAAGTARTGGAA